MAVHSHGAASKFKAEPPKEEAQTGVVATDPVPERANEDKHILLSIDRSPGAVSRSEATGGGANKTGKGDESVQEYDRDTDDKTASVVTAEDPVAKGLFKYYFEGLMILCVLAAIVGLVCVWYCYRG